jgi:signal transduction histidine kinase
VLGLVIGGLVLSGIFRASVQGDFDSRLKFDLDGLIAAAEPNAEGVVALHERFNDPRFERVYSGWYWEIAPEQKGDIQISRSLWDRGIKLNDFHVHTGVKWGYGLGPEDRPVRVVARRIQFPIAATPSPSDFRSYIFIMAGDTAEVASEVSNFNTMLIWSFAILGLGLIGAIFFQVRVGLLPLRRVRVALARIRTGHAQRLEGNFPAEIAPLATELNALIDHNAKVVERARTQVSNLAHSLKTPLSVLSSEAEARPGPLANVVMRAVGTMRRQIDHYLARARVSGAVEVLGKRTPVKPVLDDLARVLSRIHGEREIAISVDCPPSIDFRGDRQDLEELAGNLVDNACKWAKATVEVRAHNGAEGKFELQVDDDGPGLSAEERQHIGEQRGERLDETVPGSGHGLAIVRDIARLYGGSLDLGESPLGGLQARLALPRAA